MHTAYGHIKRESFENCLFLNVDYMPLLLSPETSFDDNHLDESVEISNYNENNSSFYKYNVDIPRSFYVEQSLLFDGLDTDKIESVIDNIEQKVKQAIPYVNPAKVFVELERI